MQGAAAPFDYLPTMLMGAGNDSLHFFIKGVQVGMAVRQQENAKFTRIALIASLTFGFYTLMKHFNE